MRIAFLSDIHANRQALSCLEKDLSGADLVVCLGDYVGYFCGVNVVVDAVRRLGGICILGNHDHFLLHGCPEDALPAVKFGIEYAKAVITPENRAWLSGLPMAWGGTVGGVSLFICHGSPWNPLHDYLYADSPYIRGLDGFQYDIIAYGQTHRAFMRFETRPHLLNPGSVGQSRDRVARACAAILDTETMRADMIERPYNAEEVLQEAFDNGAREWITRHMRQTRAED